MANSSSTEARVTPRMLRSGTAVASGLRGVVTAEVAVLAALTCAFFGFYVFAGYPIYNDATWLDPWYYTGLFVNFHFLYTGFPTAYYGSRLPWLIPGRILFGVFSPTVAYLVLHVLFGVAATVFLYLLVRRYFGRGAAVVVFAAAAASPVYYHTLYRDYVNSGELTYLLAGAYFGLAARAGRRPRAAMAAAGFFLLAALATHFFAALLVAVMVVPYAILFRPSVRVLTRDAAAFVTGAAVLFLVCAVYSTASGGRFDFIAPGIGALRSFNGADYKRSGVSWMLSEPSIFVPFFLLAVAALATRAARRTLGPEVKRAAVALGAYLAVTYVIVLVWELAGKGILIEWIDYYEIFFSMAVIPFIGVAAWSLLRLAPSSSARWAVAMGVVAAVLPPLALYRLGWTSYLDRRGAALSGVIMIVTLAAAWALVNVPGRRGMRGALASIAVAGLGLGVAYPVASSNDIYTHMNYTSTTNAVDTGVFQVGIEWVRWMQANDLQDRHMVTWYDGRDEVLNGLPSLYYYGWTLQDAKMPTVTPAFRELWNERRPSRIVLLCDRSNCERAPDALRRAGYTLRQIARRHFASGPIELWVRVLEPAGHG